MIQSLFKMERRLNLLLHTARIHK